MEADISNTLSEQWEDLKTVLFGAAAKGRLYRKKTRQIFTRPDIPVLTPASFSTIEAEQNSVYEEAEFRSNKVRGKAAKLKAG